MLEVNKYRVYSAFADEGWKCEGIKKKGVFTCWLNKTEAEDLIYYLRSFKCIDVKVEKLIDVTDEFNKIK